MPVKIAVATDDGTRVSQHFGRTPFFAIVTMDEGRVTSRETRPNTFTAHARQGGHTPHGDGHNHSHAGVVEGLGDCNAIVCGGAGWRLRDALQSAGLELVITDIPTVDGVIDACLSDKLADTGAVCRGHQHENGH